MNPRRLLPGEMLGTNAALTLSMPSSAAYYYFEWPEGVLNFLQTIAVGTTLQVDYFAYWERVEVDDEQQLLVIPRWMEEAVRWYVLSMALVKPGAQAANLGQYKTRRDSGSPEDNPLLQYARYCLRRYNEALANHPTQDRSGWET